MSVELHAANVAARPERTIEAARDIEPEPHRRHPNVSGDLPTVFQAAPMFRRTVAGYDRFQVDTYVQWAEDELATADREREHLLARHLRTRAALQEARSLLAHSSGGGEFLRLSERIGSMLAAAADQAESMRAEAEAGRCAASEEAERIVARAEQELADAEAEAERVAAAAALHMAEMTAEAGRIVDEAELVGSEARAEAEARLAKVRLIEQRAVEQAEQIRSQAVQDASAARLAARDEIVRMLGTGREQRRRADAEAAALRERQDRDAAARLASLRTEVKALERRRSTLRAQVAVLADKVEVPTESRLELQLRRGVERLRWMSRSLRSP